MSNKERGSYARSDSIPYPDDDQRRVIPYHDGVCMIITMIETLLVMSMPFLFIGAALETAGEVADASR